MEIYLDCSIADNEHAIDGLFDNTDQVQDTKGDDAPNGEVETKARKETFVRKKAKRNGGQFNEKYLCSKSGLSRLAQMFENAGFIRGNEEEKLDQLLKQFEHWAHQMYPRYQSLFVQYAMLTLRGAEKGGQFTPDHTKALFGPTLISIFANLSKMTLTLYTTTLAL